MSRLFLAVFAATLALSAPPATAQDYPNRPITLVVPCAAGGGDPRIHLLTRMMDCRVKPGNDDGATGATAG